MPAVPPFSIGVPLNDNRSGIIKQDMLGNATKISNARSRQAHSVSARSLLVKQTQLARL
jgi:hypothetical protein